MQGVSLGLGWRDDGDGGREGGREGRSGLARRLCSTRVMRRRRGICDLRFLSNRLGVLFFFVQGNFCSEGFGHLCLFWV